ncbi:hypothetical protein HWV62_622 [Athelia sp. TMB]|nr:hypothetical protein HWV62_622 [Athelia sp. TMB]
MIDTLPVELTSHILQFACTDDGSTARALSRVSAYMNEVVKPWMYQSIAVAGHAQIATLERILSRTPAHARRTRAICIADTSRTADAAKLLVPHLTRLLALLSPAVEVLALECAHPRTSSVLVSFLFGLHHPRLRALAVRGYYPFPHLPRAMPRLTHLHLSGNRNPHGLLMAGGLEAAFPSLTHLRVSGLQGARTFARELAEAVEGAEGSGDGGLWASKLPPSVQHIIIQPNAPLVVPAQDPSKPSAHDYMLETLHTLAATHAEGKEDAIHCVLLPSPTEIASTERDDRWRADWRDSLDGGEGCWSVPAC